MIKVDSGLGAEHESVEQLQQNLEDREGNDTNSMAWMVHDPLPRCSPQLSEAKNREKAEIKETSEALGTGQNTKGLRQSMRIQQLKKSLELYWRNQKGLEGWRKTLEKQ